MNAQRLLKLLAVISIATTALAVLEWYETRLPPSPVMLKISAGAFVAALLTGLVGQETRPRMMLRFLAAVSALVAVIAFVADYSKPGDGYATLAAHLSQFAPSLYATLKAGLTRVVGSGGWEFISQVLNHLPTFLAFGMLAAICGFASRPRERLSVFVN